MTELPEETLTFDEMKAALDQAKADLVRALEDKAALEEDNVKLKEENDIEVAAAFARGKKAGEAETELAVRFVRLLTFAAERVSMRNVSCKTSAGYRVQ